MDERVYQVQVCANCFTQVSHGDGEWDPCWNCSSIESKEIRFRVQREQMLKQADPHQSLVERTVYFGCVDQAGHHYWLRGSGGRPYSAGRLRDTVTPWGYKVDGGLLPKNSGIDLEQGHAHVVHEHGWTALAFTDRSVDSRQGSWSVFCIPDIVDGTEALLIAKAAFQPIFKRYEFEVVLAQ